MNHGAHYFFLFRVVTIKINMQTTKLLIANLLTINHGYYDQIPAGKLNIACDQ